MPKRNYGYEKRQKELNRQRLKEAKQQRKLDRSNARADKPVSDEVELQPDRESGPA